MRSCYCSSYLLRRLEHTTNPILKDVKLGLDLQGGFEVLYQVQELKDGQKITEEVVADTAKALRDGSTYSVSVNRVFKLNRITGFVSS